MLSHIFLREEVLAIFCVVVVLGGTELSDKTRQHVLCILRITLYIWFVWLLGFAVSGITSKMPSSSSNAIFLEFYIFSCGSQMLININQFN